jgi:hypothetical protein
MSAGQFDFIHAIVRSIATRRIPAELIATFPSMNAFALCHGAGTLRIFLEAIVELSRIANGSALALDADLALSGRLLAGGRYDRFRTVRIFIATAPARLGVSEYFASDAGPRIVTGQGGARVSRGSHEQRQDEAENG